MWFTIEDDGPVRTLTFRRPERRNAIPADGWGDLTAAFEDFEGSPARVLVVAGEGGSFCSGADLDPSGGIIREVVASRDRMQVVHAAALALYQTTKPTIAAVDGVAAGAGMNLALGCDVVVASTRARFSEIFVRRGLTLDFGGSWLLPRIVGMQRAKELALTGRIVEADEALALGLCAYLVEPDELDARVKALAGSLASAAPVGQMFAKAAMQRSFELSFEEALAWEAQNQAICFGTEDVVEGVMAFVEKRPPEFRGR